MLLLPEDCSCWRPRRVVIWVIVIVAVLTAMARATVVPVAEAAGSREEEQQRGDGDEAKGQWAEKRRRISRRNGLLSWRG